LSDGAWTVINSRMGNGSIVSTAVTGSVEQADETAMSFPRRVFERWKKGSHAIGVVQTRFLMLVMYVLAVLPTGLLMRAFRDPLHLRPREDGNWVPIESHKPDLDSARRQF
jgi:hypothetical protein